LIQLRKSNKQQEANSKKQEAKGGEAPLPIASENSQSGARE